ncbi:LLM class flavin-dependent oxidoreductase [Amycolatopsis sp. NPDC051102]|uniref:LLM class flavin-dependent oxidoreductase n=1 Tax=Amycolatopsis sp. NPDC051102 TaxID=3155163 RepID=UPI00343D4D1C
MFYAEHTHVPEASRRADDIPTRDYAETYDPFVALAAITTTLKLGTAVCLVPDRDRIVTAKEVAGMDRMPAGRFEFGVGPGGIVRNWPITARMRVNGWQCSRSGLVRCGRSGRRTRRAIAAGTSRSIHCARGRSAVKVGC